MLFVFNGPADWIRMLENEFYEVSACVLNGVVSAITRSSGTALNVGRTPVNTVNTELF